MDIKLIKQKWENVTHFREIKGFRALRMSDQSGLELYLGITHNDHRCLILFTPADENLKEIKPREKQNISLFQIPSKGIVLIQLNDNNLKEQFNELVLSLHSRMSLIVDTHSHSSEFVNAFHQWVELFEPKQNDKLQPHIIKGLFGELTKLRELMVESILPNYNVILESWKGPYGKSNDFVFDDLNLEIKTIDNTRTIVPISSEYQLDQDGQKGLDLVVMLVSDDQVNGSSIYQVIKQIIKLIRESNSNITIFLKALREASLAVESSKGYNNLRFKLHKQLIFDTTNDEFPKIVKSKLPSSLSSVRFDLNIKNLPKGITPNEIAYDN